MLSALVLILVAETAKAELDKVNLKKLQGTWQIIEHEHGGKKMPAKELAKLSMEVSGSKMTTREAGELKEETTIIGLDAKAKPAALEMKVASGADIDKVVKGIYKVDGDTLTICVAEPGKDRPKEFAGKEGTGCTLMVFKRNKKSK